MINKFSNINMSASNNVKLKNMVDAPKVLESRNVITSKNYDLNKLGSSSSEVESIDVDINTKVGMSKYSTTGYSDTDNIYMNQFDRIMVELKNKLSDEQYMIYCKYFEGKKVSNMVDENGYLQSINNLDELKSIMNQLGIKGNELDIMNNINSIINPEDGKGRLRFSNRNGNLSISKNILNCTIYEINSTDSGYDYTILVDSKGSPILINACTNANELEDIAAIAYALSKQLIGKDADDFVDELFGILSNVEGVKLSKKEIDEFYNSIIEKDIKDFSSFENYYLTQVEDSQKAIEKCIDIAKENDSKAILNGYSLGGGVLLTSYSKLCKEEPENEKYILGVSTFNPFISIAEQYDGIDAIDYIAKSEKVSIYANEEDFVSIFNNSVEKLLEHFVFVKAEGIDETVTGVLDFFGFVIGSKSNHGFAPVMVDNFDENGNIINEGEFHRIDWTISDIDGKMSFFEAYAMPVEEFVNSHIDLINAASEMINKDIEIPNIKLREVFKINEDYKPNYSTIISCLLRVADINLPDGEDAKSELVNNMLYYVKNNVGRYNYDELVKILADGMWKMIDEKIQSKNWFKRGMANIFGNEKVFKKTITNFFSEEANKDLLISMITELIKKDKVAYKDDLEDLIKRLGKTYDKQIDKKYDWYRPLPAYINSEIKEQFLKELKKALDF